MGPDGGARMKAMMRKLQRVEGGEQWKMVLALQEMEQWTIGVEQSSRVPG